MEAMLDMKVTKLNLAGNTRGYFEATILGEGTFIDDHFNPITITVADLKKLAREFEGKPVRYVDMKSVTPKDTHVSEEGADSIGKLNLAYVLGNQLHVNGYILPEYQEKFLPLIEKAKNRLSAGMDVLHNSNHTVELKADHLAIIPPCVKGKFCANPQYSQAKITRLNNAIGEPMNEDYVKDLESKVEKYRLLLADMQEDYIQNIIAYENFQALQEGKPFNLKARIQELMAMKPDELMQTGDMARQKLAEIQGGKAEAPMIEGAMPTTIPQGDAKMTGANKEWEDMLKELNAKDEKTGKPKHRLAEKLNVAMESNGGNLGQAMGLF